MFSKRELFYIEFSYTNLISKKYKRELRYKIKKKIQKCFNELALVLKITDLDFLEIQYMIHELKKKL